jgi:2-methylisocitrate lyase-like PEP mutase family enzyme
MNATDVAAHFRSLHEGPAPLLLANAWDVGSARVLASLGFAALATTSSGFAATLGRPDGGVTRDEALAHAKQIAQATALPVSADLEDCFAAEPSGVSVTIALAVQTGVAGASIEDYTRDDTAPIYDVQRAAERVRAAAEAAHTGPRRIILTARAENYLYDREDLGDTISRLQAYQEAGADVLFAPGLLALEDVRTVVEAVDRPVNVLALPSSPSVADLADVGVRRISVGGSFAFAALGALATAGRELLEQGTYGYRSLTGIGREAAQAAFGD